MWASFEPMWASLLMNVRMKNSFELRADVGELVDERAHEELLLLRHVVVLDSRDEGLQRDLDVIALALQGHARGCSLDVRLGLALVLKQREDPEDDCVECVEARRGRLVAFIILRRRRRHEEAKDSEEARDHDGR